MNLAPYVKCSAAAAVTLLGTAGCNMSWSPFSATETRELSMAWQESPMLNVSTRNGSVDVSVDEQIKDVMIVANVRASGDTQEEADARLKTIEVVSEYQSNGQLAIYPVIPLDEWRGNDGCSLTITLPKSMGVTGESSNGSITLTGMRDTANAQTSNGAVTVLSHAGDVTINTSNGKVRVIDATGAIDVDTSNGRVEIVGFTRSVDVRTSNGRIECSTSVAGCGPVALRSSNGSVKLLVPATLAGAITAITSNGSVSVSGEGVSVSGRKTNKTVRFSATGPESIIRTSNGAISITVQP